MFSKVLIANRGEIAVRIIRSLRELGIQSVAVYSEADRQALHVRMADEAYLVGAAPSAQSYLRAEVILEVAQKSGAEAIHPGYGFLSENATFAAQCAEAGIVFIGPTPSAIEAMGEKTHARQLMLEAGVPLVPGTQEPIEDVALIQRLAAEMGYPVLVKAAAGGGGKGMRRVERAEDLEAAFVGAKREALSAFGNGAVYLEKYVVNPKHVEIQVLADAHGNCVHLFERDCSVQRRHQKIIEETPCAVLTEEVRQQMGAVAVRAAQAVGYVGAGTLEFLLDADLNFYFLEMNTRLQVEHPITEMITGLDLVRWQLRIAAGERLPFSQADIVRRGAAIECRIYAEDPDNNFMPCPGELLKIKSPAGPWVREDSGVYSGATVSVHYDPMIAKLVVWGEDRSHAIARMRRALGEYVIDGITTNVAFHDEVLRSDQFVAGDYDTEFVPNMMKAREPARPAHRDTSELAAVLAAHRRDEAIAGGAGSTNGVPVEGGVEKSRWKSLGRYRQLQNL
ncbi:MAG: acetyl-CoA carboxylase biotin carboxylase subunit [Bradymonadaceae bacterium]|nr:acetyl-CoA carboxylase biotin carboxylase subunit [Lujinxingiaceae bacterium]